ncbi:MAG: hypothetical protein QOJ68_1513 [Blastococcus sp.]|jgi:hypothetical protein|nr:hypothetical protein [Blastococcus sp.]
MTSAVARRPSTVVSAAVLSAVYSLGLLWFGFAALSVLFRTGGWGNPMAARGMVFVGAAGLVGAALLIGGAALSWRGSYACTLVPLLAVLVLGSIGEAVDLGGTATAQSNLIGAVILVAAAVPVGLLSTRSARNFAAARRRRPVDADRS